MTRTGAGVRAGMPGFQEAQVVVAPSLYAAPPLGLGEAVRAAADGGADALHLDVMDGHFVAPISFGNLVVHAVRAATSLPLDAHLMVANPQAHLAWLADAGVRSVTVHLEAFDPPEAVGATLRAIRALGMRAGLALKPATGAEAIASLAREVDHVLVMTVEPGRSGQPFLASMMPKVRAVATTCGPTVEIGVDGGINEATARQCVAAGATYLVAGSAVFAGGMERVGAALARLRASAAP